MDKFKKLIFALPIGLIALLLILAGLNLVQLSQNLFLYIGILLLLLSAGLYFFAK